MITNKIELKEVLKYEKKMYLGDSSVFRILKLAITKEYVYSLWKFVYFLRKCEYFKNVRSSFVGGG